MLHIHATATGEELIPDADWTSPRHCANFFFFSLFVAPMPDMHIDRNHSSINDL